jgi:hypothetical protein
VGLQARCRPAADALQVPCKEIRRVRLSPVGRHALHLGAVGAVEGEWLGAGGRPQSSLSRRADGPVATIWRCIVFVLMDCGSSKGIPIYRPFWKDGAAASDIPRPVGLSPGRARRCPTSCSGPADCPAR